MKKPRIYARRAALLGFLLALACHAVPPEYRELCDLIAQVCTAGATT